MKGGLVIALAALEALAEAGEPLAWTLLLNSDEEVDEIARRAERLGHIVLVVMALCFIGAPALYLASLYP